MLVGHVADKGGRERGRANLVSNEETVRKLTARQLQNPFRRGLGDKQYPGGNAGFAYETEATSSAPVYAVSNSPGVICSNNIISRP